MYLLLPRLRLVVLGRRRSVVLLVLVLLRRRVHVRQHQKDDGRRANYPDGDPDVASGDKDSRDSEDLTLTTEMRGKDLNIEFMFNFKPALHGGDRSVGRRRRDRLGPDCGGGAGHLGEGGDGDGGTNTGTRGLQSSSTEYRPTATNRTSPRL